MNIIYFIASICFFVVVIRNTLFWIALWQAKEYRFDRFFVHFRETSQAKEVFFSKVLWLKIATICFYPAVFTNEYQLLPPYQFFITFLYFFIAIFVLREYIQRKLKRPKITAKTIFIAGLTTGGIFLFYLFPVLDAFLWLLVIERLVPFLVAFIVLVLSIPTEFQRDFQIERATAKLRKNKNVLVIGITGSYGKSSTKHFMAQILEKKFRVVKTPGTHNTAIGIANTILANLKNNTEIFIAEMGAYKRGEIKELCEMVRPIIGVLTAVTKQHLSLFGSIENIKKTKYELIEALPKTGIAVFNGDDEISAQLFKTTKKRKILYSTKNKNTKKNIKNRNKYGLFISASHVSAGKEYITFDVSLSKRTYHLKTPLIGEQAIENILPGIFIADYLGMSELEIKRAVASLRPLPQTMVKHEFSSGAVAIDDTYNSNLMAIAAVLSYMELYSGKRILVLQPLIELGKNAADDHYQIGRAAGKVCTHLLITNKNFFVSLSEGIKDSNSKCEIYMGNSDELSNLITKIAGKRDVVAFEGREAKHVLSAIL